MILFAIHRTLKPKTKYTKDKKFISLRVMHGILPPKNESFEKNTETLLPETMIENVKMRHS